MVGLEFAGAGLPRLFSNLELSHRCQPAESTNRNWTPFWVELFIWLHTGCSETAFVFVKLLPGKKQSKIWKTVQDVQEMAGKAQRGQRWKSARGGI